MKSSIWYEKYRPQTIHNFIFPNEKIRNKIERWVEEDELFSVLLSGSQGTGKSTLARVLRNHLIEDADYLEINASLSGGIDSIRDKVMPFVQMAPIGKRKLVLFEEGDRLSIDSQKSLRQIIEDYNKNTVFIFTCNYPNKIIPALHSRFEEEISFGDGMEQDAIFDYCFDILFQENVNIPYEDDEALNEFTNKLEQHIHEYYPDVRKIVNSLQANVLQQELTAPQKEEQGIDDIEEWRTLWENRPNLEDATKLAKNIDHDNYEQFYRIMYENVHNLDKERQERAIVLIGLFLWRSGTVADQEMNLVSCLYRIFHEIDE